MLLSVEPTWIERAEQWFKVECGMLYASYPESDGWFAVGVSSYGDRDILESEMNLLREELGTAFFIQGEEEEWFGILKYTRLYKEFLSVESIL